MLDFRSKIKFICSAITRSRPLYAQLMITDNCNLSCKMCGQAALRGSRSAELNRGYNRLAELTLEELEVVATNLRKVGSPLLVITGGEPFLRKDLEDIVRIFRKQGIQVRIQSNGQLINEDRIDALLSLGVSEYSISLDTLDFDKQDQINGRTGSGLQAIKALAILSRVLPRRANFTLVNTVVSPLNLHDLLALIKFVTRIGFFHSLIPAHVRDNTPVGTLGVGGKTLSSHDHNFKFITFCQLDSIFQQVLEMKKSGYHIHNSERFLRDSLSFLKGEKVVQRCLAPDVYFHIRYDGSVTACLEQSSGVGLNIANDDFWERYKRKSEYRKKLKTVATSCHGCMYACYAELNYFCTNLDVFIRRGIDDFRKRNYQRKVYSYSEMLSIVKECCE
ncbi:MAG: radical SAM protein [Oligoflexia bacterium]|nr:radical SAM protein [Oligoflexia bacterium]